MKTSFDPIFFTLLEGEGLEEDAFGDSSVESPIIAHDVVDHPTGGRAAYDEKDVFAFSGP